MERDLIRRIQAGDRQAFDGIYSLYASRLVAYCRAYVGSREDVEELVQDVFVALWNSRGNIRNPETLGPLLFRSMRNRIINYYRSRINTPLYEDYVNIREKREAEESRPAIFYNEFRQTVADRIAELPETQRRAITLSRFEGKSNEEIASILGIKVQSVKNAIHIGLGKLRQALRDSEGIDLPVVALLFSLLSL